VPKVGFWKAIVEFFYASRFMGMRFSMLMAVFAAALIAMLWLAIVLQVDAERRSMNSALAQQTKNLALVFRSSVNRTASEMDRVLRYLRASYVRAGFKVDWPKLVQAEFTANKRTVQIAVIGKDGMMITSSKMLYPDRPIDLSFREHYKIHARNQVDQLYISEPLVGKASGKWSVQFARPFFAADGSFNGVIVVSLDPNFLTRDYASVDLGTFGGVAVLGDDNVFRAVSGRYAKLLGKKTSALGAQDIVLPKAGNGATFFMSDAKRPMLTSTQASADFPFSVIVTRDGARQFEAWTVKRNRYFQGGTFLTGLIIFAVVVGIVWRQRYERQLLHLARHDSLTGLLNRMDFVQQVRRLLCDHTANRGFNVLMVDLDHFKGVNDTYGHPVADEVLVEVARRLRRATRSKDIVARLGGDEFAVIQRSNEGRRAGEALAARICDVLAKPYEVDGKLIETGGSIGLILDASSFGNEEEIMHAVDLALYAAKRDGRGIYRVFTSSMNDEARQRAEIEIGLRQALNEEQLEVHYQPIVSAESGEARCVEALIRWRHPTKGMIPPGIFIPVAEQTGLVNRIGKWVLKRACSDIAQNFDHLMLAVNISAVEFRDTDVANSVREALAASGLAGERLKVEITESLLLRQDAATCEQLEHIRELGVSISMDDFGTGYSSLSYLHKYPIDQIKIDRSFIREVADCDRAAEIVRAIVAMAKCMDIATVAEGIETSDQHDIVAGTGCDLEQGYYFGRPTPLDELKEAVRHCASKGSTGGAETGGEVELASA